MVEMWATWLMTWLDMSWHDNAGTFVLLLECMSSYNAAGWWMSSWCIIASPLLGEVCRVFDGPWFTWWSFTMLFPSCMLEGLTGSSVCEVHVHRVRPLCMLPSFVLWWTCHYACATFVCPIPHLAMFVGVRVPVVTHDETISNPKPPSLPWHMIIQMQVTRRGRKVVMQDDGFGKLLMRTMQESLRDGDSQSELTVTICKV